MILLDHLWSGDSGIAQTVEKIKKAIYYSLREPQQRIRKRAEQILRDYAVPERNDLEEIRVISNWVKDHFHFVNDPSGVEFVKSPEMIDDEITQYDYFMGDCDDASGYVAALLKSVGYPVALTVIANPKNPAQNFTHIFPQSFLVKSQKWVTLDMTAKGKPFGWQAKASRLQQYPV